jgi:hypothetical protein
MRASAQGECRYGWLSWSSELGYSGIAEELADVLGGPRSGVVIVAPSQSSAQAVLEGRLGQALPKATVVTPRSRGVTSAELVVCLWADADEVALARRCVRSGGLVLIVEEPNRRLDGWARAVGALNLRELAPVPPLSGALISLLDDLDFHGNNGFLDITRRHGARRTLAHLGQLEEYTRDLVLGALIARGYRGEHLDRLLPFMP